MQQFFIEWVNLIFGPAVKKYLQENKLPMKALLILENAPAHPPGFEDDILYEFKFVKVLYLPPNTTSILQPMDQQVISNIKKLYTKHLFSRCFEVTENTILTLREFWKDHYNIMICLHIIDLAWQEVIRRTLNSAWKKLWPDVVADRDFEEFEPETETEVEMLEENVSLGKSTGLEVDEGDVNELIKEHEEELSTEELKELQMMQHTELLQGSLWEASRRNPQVKKEDGYYESLSHREVQRSRRRKIACFLSQDQSILICLRTVYHPLPSYLQLMVVQKY
ncbi:tigger transposable element-derived protein 1-like [Saccopteryx bilineata]|uniref:tigger transposable element-derived protein 1-like n=1 Tax=Saccopteryx bilineata TaxID=59482 RepID=UPI00338FE56F